MGPMPGDGSGKALSFFSARKGLKAHRRWGALLGVGVGQYQLKFWEIVAWVNFNMPCGEGKKGKGNQRLALNKRHQSKKKKEKGYHKRRGIR